MKKALTVIVLCITFIIIYLLQLNFFSWFTIAGVMPNLFIIFILFIGLYLGSRIGMAFGLLFGFIIDTLSSNVIGGATAILGLIGFMRRIPRKEFVKRQ